MDFPFQIFFGFKFCIPGTGKDLRLNMFSGFVFIIVFTEMHNLKSWPPSSNAVELGTLDNNNNFSKYQSYPGFVPVLAGK